MTVGTPPYGPRVFSVGVFFDVAVAAQRVEHRFDLEADIRISSVAVDAEALAGVVGEVVVAGDAVDRTVVEMRERQRQQRTRVDHRLTTLISGARGDHDENADDCGERGAARSGFHDRLRNRENAAAIVNAAAPM